jgi:hypothetical protein
LIKAALILIVSALAAKRIRRKRMTKPKIAKPTPDRCADCAWSVWSANIRKNKYTHQCLIFVDAHSPWLINGLCQAKKKTIEAAKIIKECEIYTGNKKNQRGNQRGN